MISQSSLALLALPLLVSASSPAPEASSSPLGASYQAILPSLSTTPIIGSVTGSTNANGTGTHFVVSLQNIPSTGGPYIYHIHQSSVPSNGNCTGTGPHLDPQSRGEKPACDPTNPATCQVGDLAGKHGSVNTTSYSAQSVANSPSSSSSLSSSPNSSAPASLSQFLANSFPNDIQAMVVAYSNGTNTFTLRYSDDFVSTLPGNAAFFGNRSVVVHDGAGNRLTCANFTLQQLGQGVPSSVTSLLPQPTATAATGSSAPAGAASPVVSAAAGASSTPVAAANATTPVTGTATASTSAISTNGTQTFKGDAMGRSSGMATTAMGAMGAAAVMACLL